MDEEVIVHVLTNGVQVVVKLLDFLVLAEHLNILHLLGDQVVKLLDQLLFKLLGELVA